MKNKHSKWVIGFIFCLCFLIGMMPVYAAQQVKDGIYKIANRGQEVRLIQERLVELGYLESKSTTGYFGTVTQAAVKAFQKDSGLKADGIVGRQTLQALYSEKTEHATAAVRGTYRQGDESEAVRTIQKQLVLCGYMKEKNTTGYFGSITLTAVKSFQKDSGLKVDGIAGEKTCAKLYELSNKGAAEDKGTQKPEVVKPAETLQNCGILRLGSKGEAVKELQKNLTWRRFYKGEITGVFDSATLTAVKKFQASCRLTQDGIVGANTKKWLLHNSDPICTKVSKYVAPDKDTLDKKYETLAKEEKDNIYLLAQLIYAEFGGGCYEGQVAVGNVVMNRVKTTKTSISEVIFAKNQFSPAKDGVIHNVPSKESVYAAIEAYFGADPVGDSLYFNTTSSTYSWGNKNRILYRIIEGDAFFV